jgi:hypothetical protein
MIVSVHQPQYMPWLGYFDKIARSDAFVFLDNVQYKPREFQNRNKIRTKDGWLWLSVPVISKGKGRQVISDVRIDNELDWPKEHLMSLKTCYGRAKYFDRYFPFFEDLYGKSWESLALLNIYIIKYLLKDLSIDTPLYFESDLDITTAKTERIVDICLKLKADTYLSGAGGRAYIEEDKFVSSGLKLSYQDFSHPVYTQQFMKARSDFIPYMSIIDLLFTEGPGAKEVMKI